MCLFIVSCKPLLCFVSLSLVFSPFQNSLLHFLLTATMYCGHCSMLLLQVTRYIASLFVQSHCHLEITLACSLHIYFQFLMKQDLHYTPEPVSLVLSPLSATSIVSSANNNCQIYLSSQKLLFTHLNPSMYRQITQVTLLPLA